MHEGVTTVVTLHEESPEADVVDMMGILHDGVNVTVCVDVSITVDTTCCGLSTDTISSTIFETHNIFTLQVHVHTGTHIYLLPAAVSHMSLTLLFPQILLLLVTTQSVRRASSSVQ